MWTSPGAPPTWRGVPISIQSADRTLIKGNIIMQGAFVAASTVDYGIYIDDYTGGDDADGTIIDGNSFGTFDTAGVRLQDADADGTTFVGLNTTVSDGGGVNTVIRGGSIDQASLIAATNGSYIGCSDCTADADCAPAGGTGALAKRQGGAWVCN